MERSRPLLEELALLGARALSLGEEAAQVLARLAAILGVILVGWIAYRLIAILIGRLLRQVEGVTASPARAITSFLLPLPGCQVIFILLPSILVNCILVAACVGACEVEIDAVG